MGKKVIFLLAVLLLNVSYKGLSQGTLIIYDKIDGRTLPDAHICFESFDKTQTSYALSDQNGRVKFSINGSSVISVSYIGYESYLDTIHPGDTKSIFMSPSSVSMEDVIVTAQISPKKADQSIYKVKVINSSIVEKKGATNLSDLMSNELNFSPVRDAALGSSVRIQGLGGEHVKILVDGVPMIGRQNGILDLSQINVAFIDHIEIVEGPMSVVYGSNAMAGVINIITKENKRPSLNSSLNSYYESVGIYDFDGLFSYRKGKNSFGFSTGRYFFDGFSETDTSRSKEWNPKLQHNAEAYYALNLKDLKIKLSSDYFNEELRDNGNLNSELNYKGAFDYYHFTRRLDNKLNIDKKLSGKQNILLTGAYSYYRKSKISYLNDLVKLEKITIPENDAHDTTTFRNIYSRGTYSNENFEKIAFQAGYEVVFESATGKRLSEDERLGDISSFLSLVYLPFSSLSLQPGIRYIKNLKYDAPLVYSLNMKWEASDFLSLRASYSKGFRSPSIKELYLNFQDINHNITGNPLLESETGNNFNTWVDLKIERVNHSFTLANNIYYNLIKNKIELLYDPDNPSKAVYFNVPVGSVISRGFSSNLTYQLHPRLTLDGGIYHNQLSSIVSTSNFTRSTDYATSFRYKNIKYKFELSLFYKYTDRYSRYSGSIDMNTGELMDVELSYIDNYHNMDATLSVPLSHSSFILTSGVKNIFDNTSITSSGGGGVHSGGSDVSLLNYGRTVFLRLTYNFNKFFK